MNFLEECIARFENEKEYNIVNSKLVNHITPLVSVTVSTYQHKNYIKDCLEGILMQETNFPVEIIIGEDESTDGTREICIEYAKKYSDKIRLFLRNRKTSQLYDSKNNFVMMLNIWWTMMSARGKYISICEGDDYWTDPHKLQKQVDFLEEHNECTLCFHRVKIREEELEPLDFFPKQKLKEFVDIEEILNDDFIPTASIVFRREMLKKIPNWMMGFVFGDRAINLVCAQHGKIRYIDDVMGIYRSHPGSIWTSQYKSVGGWINADIKIFEFYEMAVKYFDKKYLHIINYKRINFCLGIARGYCCLGQKKKALKYLKQAMDIILKSSGLTIKEKIRFIVKVAKISFLAAFTGGNQQKNRQTKNASASEAAR